MSTITLQAETRTDLGKGASRRLRRLEQKIPAVIYGGDKKAQSVHVHQFQVNKALENDSIYSSVFPLIVDGKKENVILKALQRHPAKPVILHMDFLRVSAKDVLVRMVPLHFMHEEKSDGVKEGGVVNHTMNQVEIRCQAQHLPEFIEVDLSQLHIDDVVHLSDLILPEHVQLATDPMTGDHNHPVVGIHRSHAHADDDVATEADVAKEVPVAGDVPASEDESAS